MAAAVIYAAFGDGCDLYEVFGVERSADTKELTKAYRRLALRYHPDKQRGDEKARAEATAKFQAVSAIHALLSDADARAQYDETGTIQAPEDDLSKSPSFQMWVDYFARIFPKVTQDDIAKFEQQYRFSDEEKRDVLDAYAKFEGDMRNLMDSIMLSTDDDEDRFVEMIEKAIKSKEVKRFSKFKEFLKARAAKPAQTETQKRKKQASRDKEAKEAESLMETIRRNQERRANGESSALSTKRERGFASLVASIESKYADKSPAKGKKRKQRVEDEPPEPTEEEFLAAQQRIKKRQRGVKAK